MVKSRRFGARRRLGASGSLARRARLGVVLKPVSGTRIGLPWLSLVSGCLVLNLPVSPTNGNVNRAPCSPSWRGVTSTSAPSRQLFVDLRDAHNPRPRISGSQETSVPPSNHFSACNRNLPVAAKSLLGSFHRLRGNPTPFPNRAVYLVSLRPSCRYRHI